MAHASPIRLDGKGLVTRLVHTLVYGPAGSPGVLRFLLPSVWSLTNISGNTANTVVWPNLTYAGGPILSNDVSQTRAHTLQTHTVSHAAPPCVNMHVCALMCVSVSAMPHSSVCNATYHNKL